MAEEPKRNPYDLRVIFETMTLGLIGNLKRNLSRHREEEMKEGFRWEMWQKAKLRALAGYRNINRRLIKHALKEAEKLTGEVIQQSFDDGAKRAENQAKRAIRRAEEAGIKLPEDIKRKLPQPSAPKAEPKYDELPHAGDEEDFFDLNNKKLKALERSAKKDIRTASGGVLRKMDDVYRQTIFGAEAHMSAGVKTLPQAVDMATKDFLAKGIDSITYSDGRRINIASYAEMALRTASQRATFLGEGSKRDEWGVYTVVMSAHANCSPWCQPFQGTVMIDDVYTSISKEEATQLSAETGYKCLSYAMSEGAFHPNCRHTLATFFPGISRMPDIPAVATSERNYEAEQKQRYMERHIRMYKRLTAGSIDEGNEAKYSAKVDQWQERLREHLDANRQLRRDRRREAG